jgi:hypothetical protein
VSGATELIGICFFDAARFITFQFAEHRIHDTCRQNRAAQTRVQNNAGGVDGFAHMRFGGVLEKIFRLSQQRFGADALRAIQNLLAQTGQRAAETFGDERLRMLPQPAGDGFAFQQFSDCWKRSEQFLFLIRHKFGSATMLVSLRRDGSKMTFRFAEVNLRSA